MMPPGRFAKLLVTAIASLMLITYFAKRSPNRAIKNAYKLLREPSNDTFIREALEHQVTDPFNISAISELCNNRRPRADVIVKCRPGTGGVGNIRSYMLHCTRSAMEAGASIIVPRFYRRVSSNISKLIGEEQEFEHFFDRTWYKDTLSKACPDMKVYDHPQPAWRDLDITIPYSTESIIGSIEKPSPWRQEFDGWIRWIEEYIEKHGLADMQKPWIIESADPGRSHKVLDDGISFYYNFGRILQFRPDVRRLTAVAILEMSKRFHLHINPKSNIYRNAYMGAHLRTSVDAVDAGWDPNFEEQTDNYMDQARTANVSIIYVAGGNDLDLKIFAEKAQEEGLTVVSKHDLLSGNDLQELNNYDWDQKGLLDFSILERSTSFGGYARSSFSHNVAFRRHFFSRKEGDPFGDLHDHFADELSRVYERFEPDWEDEAVDTMWP